MKRVAKSLGALGLVGCALLGSQFAMADDSGWIAGLSVGQSKARIDDPQIISQLQGGGFATTTLNDVNRDMGVKVRAEQGWEYSFALC